MAYAPVSTQNIPCTTGEPWALYATAQRKDGAPWGVLSRGGRFKARPLPITGPIGIEGSHKSVQECLANHSLQGLAQ